MRVKIKLFFLIIVICLTSFMGCEIVKNNKQSATKIEKIYMEKVGLARRTSVTIVPNMVVVEVNREIDQYAVNSEEWNSLMTEIGKLNLSEIDRWEPPTKARFYDGALAEGIIITTVDSTYVTQSFDEGKPPAQLVDLYNVINSFYNKNLSDR